MPSAFFESLFTLGLLQVIAINTMRNNFIVIPFLKVAFALRRSAMKVCRQVKGFYNVAEKLSRNAVIFLLEGVKTIA